MDDGAGGGKSLRMIVQAKTGEFSNTELLAKNALAIVALESPIFEAGLDATGTFEQGSLCGFKKLLWAGEQSFARTEELEFVTESFVGARTRKFGGLKFACGQVHKRE